MPLTLLRSFKKSTTYPCLANFSFPLVLRANIYQHPSWGMYWLSGQVHLRGKPWPQAYPLQSQTSFFICHCQNSPFVQRLLLWPDRWGCYELTPRSCPRQSLYRWPRKDLARAISRPWGSILSSLCGWYVLFIPLRTGFHCIFRLYQLVNTPTYASRLRKKLIMFCPFWMS